MLTGIDLLSFYTSHYYLDLKTLAAERGVPPAKLYRGLGQERMAVPPPGEDIVTMAANACAPVLEGGDPSRIDALILATESAVDQSKAAAIYVHRLLGLPSTCRAFEVKQACCGSTAALQFALLQVARTPAKKVLVVASDIARYGLGNAGEPTQGAGAVAMLVAAEPRLLTIDPDCGSYTEDVMDFWRPNYLDEALVDGKLSIRIYLRALEASWRQYADDKQLTFNDFQHFCYHLPFSKMGVKAHRCLAAAAGGRQLSDEELQGAIGASLQYGKVVGNSYTASLYLALASLLENTPADLRDERVGLFSYGSGCMAAFFSGIIQPGYQDHLLGDTHQRRLAERIALDYPEYASFYAHALPTDGSAYACPGGYDTGQFRLTGTQGHRRLYEPCAPAGTTRAA